MKGKKMKETPLSEYTSFVKVSGDTKKLTLVKSKKNKTVSFKNWMQREEFCAVAMLLAPSLNVSSESEQRISPTSVQYDVSLITKASGRKKRVLVVDVPVRTEMLRICPE